MGLHPLVCSFIGILTCLILFAFAFSKWAKKNHLKDEKKREEELRTYNSECYNPLAYKKED